jgi:hypothetical protein
VLLLGEREGCWPGLPWAVGPAEEDRACDDDNVQAGDASDRGICCSCGDWREGRRLCGVKKSVKLD